ncbi:hypothetical protein EYC80_008773 [Monilinia laxa]|uniref:Uncharacterized protein n=1 Tax=Monilinia laxa TaxID=61186 RepID=A0A5N6K1C5_MONLA|nr:hypothetical protein EYC80_008773 [Monilinia laxa]
MVATDVGFRVPVTAVIYSKLSTEAQRSMLFKRFEYQSSKCLAIAQTTMAPSTAKTWSQNSETNAVYVLLNFLLNIRHLI